MKRQRTIGIRMPGGIVVAVALLTMMPPAAIASTTASATRSMTVTARVTASLVFDRISDGAGDVTSTTFPETSSGSVSAPTIPFHAELGSVSGRWQVAASISSPFTSADSGATLPDTAVLINGPAQGGAWVGLDSTPTLETNIARGTLTSGSFTLKLAPSADADSGSYSGVITITASTI